ncbi:MAG: hypothetical protein E7258_05295 [Lachnospiraceae bacterium]|nr:hypothetical protein [Lachnospiraceae bacterium]
MNLHNIIYYLPVDVYKFFRYKKYNECNNYGYIKIFNGYFGSGKSLSAVDEVISIYHLYNDKVVWNEDLQSFVKQKITIISNLDLDGVPYIKWESEQQFIDYEVQPSEVVLFLVDEIGTVWNNRDFKNFNPDVFNNIVQSRKRKMAIYGTLPKIVGTDVNIRRFTDDVVVCEKTWRILKHKYYKADDIENCSNLDMLLPHRIEYKFVSDKMYKQYNTNALIDKLKKDMAEGKLLTYGELNEQINGDIKQATLKKKYRKRQS